MQEKKMKLPEPSLSLGKKTRNKRLKLSSKVITSFRWRAGIDSSTLYYIIRCKLARMSFVKKFFFILYNTHK